MGIEHHRQRFSAALRVPEHAAFAVCDGCLLSGNNRLLDGKILVVCRQHLESVLSVYIEADEVFQDVQKAPLFKQALKEGVKLGIPGIFIAAVLGLPLHEAVFPGSDGARLGNREVAHHANLIIDKKRRDLVHVIAQLAVCVGSVGLRPGRGFQLHHHQRQAVDKQDHIRPLLAVLHHCPLIRHDEAVPLRTPKVRQIHQPRTLLSLRDILHRHAVLQIIREDPVLLHQRAGIKGLQPRHRVIQRRLRQPGVQFLKRCRQHLLIQGRAIIPLNVRPINAGVAQRLSEQLQHGFFVVGFSIGHPSRLQSSGAVTRPLLPKDDILSCGSSSVIVSCPS